MVAVLGYELISADRSFKGHLISTYVSCSFPCEPCIVKVICSRRCVDYGRSRRKFNAVRSAHDIIELIFRKTYLCTRTVTALVTCKSGNIKFISVISVSIVVPAALITAARLISAIVNSRHVVIHVEIRTELCRHAVLVGIDVAGSRIRQYAVALDLCFDVAFISCKHNRNVQRSSVSEIVISLRIYLVYVVYRIRALFYIVDESARTLVGNLEVYSSLTVCKVQNVGGVVIDGISDTRRGSKSKFCSQRSRIDHGVNPVPSVPVCI